MSQKIFQVLKRLENQAIKEKTRKVNIPPEKRMLAITKDTGEFFNLLLHTKKAKNVLEIGTSVGYSTLWLAEAIEKNSGKIITIEKSIDKIQRAKKNFNAAGIPSLIEVRQGNAKEILKRLNQYKKFVKFFDFVLIDADKENGLSYFRSILPMVKVGGIIATDNMIYPKKYRGEMKKYSKAIRKDKRVRSVLLPIGNGEEITIRIKD